MHCQNEWRLWEFQPLPPEIRNTKYEILNTKSVLTCAYALTAMVVFLVPFHFCSPCQIQADIPLTAAIVRAARKAKGSAPVRSSAVYVSLAIVTVGGSVGRWVGVNEGDDRYGWWKGRGVEGVAESESLVYYWYIIFFNICQTLGGVELIYCKMQIKRTAHGV